MKRIILILFLIFSLAVPAGAQMIVGGASESNTEVGYPTIGGSTGTASARGITITVPAGGLTVRYGYAYVSSSASDTITMAVYQTDGTQVGTCSAASSAIGTTAGWVEVVFSTPFALSAGTYVLQYHTTGGAQTVSYRYDATGSGERYGDNACGTLYPTNTSTRVVTMSIANYQAH